MNVPSAAAELSSVATSIDDLTRRVAAAAESLDHQPTEAAAGALYEVERALRTATRSLARARRSLRDLR
jgi:hypothetical protein